MAEAGAYNGNGNREPSGRSKKIGIVTALEGKPLENGEIASGIGGFEKLVDLEKKVGVTPEELMAEVFRTENTSHNSYQDAQAWLAAGGKKGLQAHVLLPGMYTINNAVFSIEEAEMVEIKQGEVGVVIARYGLPEKDISGKDYKFGAIVEVGHKGVWEQPLRTGMYPLNPYCYKVVIIPTSIITLNWATNVSAAHKLDSRLDTITAETIEGFQIKLELVVQLHIPENEAPKIITSVGTLQSLVNEVMQSAVGNYFRNKIQQKTAVELLNERQAIQQEAFEYLKDELAKYNKVELVAVLIQDVLYPEEMTKVLKQRQIAVQQKETYDAEKKAQVSKQDLEKERGNADTQAELAASKNRIDIAKNKASAKIEEGKGMASFTKQTGEAKADAEKALQLAQAAGIEAKARALGPELTAMVNIISSVMDSQKGIPLFPGMYIMGGENGTGAGVAGKLMQALGAFTKVTDPDAGKTYTPVVEEKTENNAEAKPEEAAEENMEEEAEEITEGTGETADTSGNEGEDYASKSLRG
jgi:regulator of protease activity HflC (stomatin/prohibitin superfamily)